MDNKRKSLYTLGGVTSILSGLLMVLSSCWFFFTGASGEDQALDVAVGVLHGIGVVTLILLVPTVAAGYVLLCSEAKVRSMLGTLFALLWIAVEICGHCSLTAPLRALAELDATPATESIVKFWGEWAEALLMTGAFLCVLAALCYGLALKSWGNAVAASLFVLCAIAFPIGVWLGLDIQLHVLIRGVAFIFLGGILLRVTLVDDDDWFGSVDF